MDILSYLMAVGLIGGVGKHFFSVFGGSLKSRKPCCVVCYQLLYFSVNSFVALGRLLLNEDGVKFLLSEKLSQEPLEEYFSKQKAKVGAGENPAVETFNRNFLGLNVAGDELVRVVNANTRGHQTELYSQMFKTYDDLQQKKAA